MNSRATCWLCSRQIFPKDSCRLNKAWGLERQVLFDVQLENCSNDIVLEERVSLPGGSALTVKKVLRVPHLSRLATGGVSEFRITYAQT
jgi:hypothetical protein